MFERLLLALQSRAESTFFWHRENILLVELEQVASWRHQKQPFDTQARQSGNSWQVLVFVVILVDSSTRPAATIMGCRKRSSAAVHRSRARSICIGPMLESEFGHVGSKDWNSSSGKVVDLDSEFVLWQFPVRKSGLSFILDRYFNISTT
jgi:hypothetical protein